MKKNSTTAQTTRAKYGQDFYHKIGAIGGAKSRGGGFTGNSEMARLAGRKGGIRAWEVRKVKSPKCECGKIMLTNRILKSHDRRGHVIL